MNSIAHRLYVIPEVTYGTTPSNPSFALVRHTGATLGLSKTSIVAKEQRSDRQVADVRHGNRQLGGDIAAELTHGNLDALLEAALCGTWEDQWSEPNTELTTAEVQSETTIASAGGDLPLLEVGDAISISGFTNPANNVSRAIVAASTVNLLTLVGTELVTEAAGDTVTITVLNQRLDCGVTRRSFSLLRHYSDQDAGDKPFHLHTGVEFNSVSLTVKVDAPVEVSFSVVGRNVTLSGTGPAGATYGSAVDGQVYVGLSGGLALDGVTLGVVTEVTLTVENGITPRFVLFDDKTTRPSINTCNVTGQLTAYFEDSSLLERFYNEDDASLVFYLTDPSGNRYTFDMPRIKLNGGQPDTNAGPITLTIPFQAVRDEVTNRVALRIIHN